MKKRAFTLLEVMISISILSLIFVYLYSSIDSLKRSNSFYEKKNEVIKFQEKILKVLYSDLILSNKKIDLLEDGSKDYSILRIDKTKNSLYNIKETTVIWFVSKEEDTLIRVESKKDINLPIKYDDIPYVYLDKIFSECKAFKLYKSNDKDKLLLYLKKENSKELIFEFNLL